MKEAKTYGPNYSLQFTISEVARVLKVTEEEIKKWSFLFAEFLSPTYQATNGTSIFSTTDLAVLGYVSVYFELEPDIDSIKLSIQADEHLGFPFYEIIQKATPIFRHVPDDTEELDPEETILVGGLIDFADLRQLAKSYKKSGDILVDKAIKDDIGYELICPIIHNYRHATELFLKSALEISTEKLKKDIGHNLIKAADIFEGKVKKEIGEDLPDWFKNIILAFDDFDRNGETFRYGGLPLNEEMLIDLAHLKDKMTWFEEIFDKVDRTS